MGQTDQEVLKRLAGKYVWWKTPDEAVAMPERVIAQVMNIGDYADVQELAAQLGDQVLIEVLSHAEAGQFNDRSWAYWHYRLDMAGVDHVPALPSPCGDFHDRYIQASVACAVRMNWT